jgi:pilus assembly protein Flp/PilA
LATAFGKGGLPCCRDWHVAWRTPDAAFCEVCDDESGATAIEYGLIAAGISIAIIAVVQGIGSQLNSNFTSIQTALTP